MNQTAAALTTDAKTAIADALNQCVAETAVTTMLAQNFHWNVKGMGFGPLHDLFQKICFAVEIIFNPGRQRLFHQGQNLRQFFDTPLKLRRIAFLGYCAIPFALTLLTSEAEPMIAIPGTLAAAICVSFGVVVERWLFFAEAKHVSMLYYGAQTS